MITLIWPAEERLVAFVMAFGAGVLISAVAFDLTAEAFGLGGGAPRRRRARGWGARLRGRRAGCSTSRATGAEGAGRALALGALLDGIPESAAIGLTLARRRRRERGVRDRRLPSRTSPSRSRRPPSFERAERSARGSSAVWTGIALASALAAALGYELLGGASDHVQAARKAFAGGAILTMLATEMMPTAFEDSGKSSDRTGDRARLRPRGAALTTIE